MREEKLNFSIILRIGVSLLPILFGLTQPAMIWCSFNIAMSFIVFGPLTSFVSSLCAVCISMFFCGFFGEGAKLEGLFLALEAILCAAACIYTLTKRKDFYTGVWLAALGYMVPSFINLKNASSHAGLSIAQYLTEVPMAMTASQLEMLGKEAPFSQFGPEIMEKLLDTIRSLVISIIPSVIVIVSVVVGYLVMWCVCARLRKLPGGIIHSFSTIRIPRIMIVIMIAALIFYFVNVGENVSYVALNVFLILFSFCSFAGLSMIDFYMRKVMRNTFLRVTIYILAFSGLSLFAGFILTVTAIIDSFVDIRKIKQRRDSCEAKERDV